MKRANIEDILYNRQLRFVVEGEKLEEFIDKANRVGIKKPLHFSPVDGLPLKLIREYDKYMYYSIKSELGYIEITEKEDPDDDFMIFYDEIDFEKKDRKTIDVEQCRYEIAKDIVVANNLSTDNELKRAIDTAERLIALLITYEMP